MPTKRLFLVILVLYLVLAIGYSIVEPLAEAPDEADHYNYITYLGQNRSLPEGTTVTQSKHPPFYHALAATLTVWTGLDFTFLRSNPDALPLGPDKPPNLFIHTTLEDFPWRGGALAMHLARFLSIALGAITVWGAWRLGGEAFPDRPAIGLLAAAFLAGLPGFLFISGSVNNDNAAGAFGTLVVLLCAMILRRGLGWGRAALLGLFLGLGLLSKVGTLALWPLVALAVGCAWWFRPNRKHALPAALGQMALAWGLGLLVASPWLFRNFTLYGDPLAWDFVRSTVDQQVGPFVLRDVGWLLSGFHRTFWGRFGGAGQIELPIWAMILAALFTFVVVIGAVRFVVSTIRQSRNSAIPQFLLLSSAPLLVFLSVVRYSAIALGTDQARLMFPALAAMAVWVGVGLVGLDRLDRWRAKVGETERGGEGCKDSRGLYGRNGDVWPGGVGRADPAWLCAAGASSSSRQPAKRNRGKVWRWAGADRRRVAYRCPGCRSAGAAAAYLVGEPAVDRGSATHAAAEAPGRLAGGRVEPLAGWRPLFNRPLAGG